MADIKLDLFDNAIDSLNEALAKYEKGKSMKGADKAYKFCVQHLSHFFELILKFYVTKSHPLFIYKNPFAKKINEESQTIGLFEAINFLKNEGHDFTPKFENDLRWLKKLRNQIEHHKFEMNITQVEKTIGRLISAFVDFDESHESIDISSYVDRNRWVIFLNLAQTYKRNLKKAMQEVKAASVVPYRCDDCGHLTMIPNEGASSGYKCAFCGGEESEDIEVACIVCGQEWPTWQMSFSTGGHDDEPEAHYCPHCMKDPEYVNDD